MTPPQPAGRVRWGSVERCAAEGRGPAPAHATSAVRARPGCPTGGMTGHLTAFPLAAARPAPCGTAWRGQAPAPSSRTGVALVCDGGFPGRPPRTPRVSGRSQGSCRSIIPDPAPSSLKHGGEMETSSDKPRPRVLCRWACPGKGSGEPFERQEEAPERNRKPRESAGGAAKHRRAATRGTRGHGAAAR